MSMRRVAGVIGHGMRFHQGMGRFGGMGRLGFLGDTSTYDPSQLPYIPTPTLSPVTGAPVPVNPNVTAAVVQSSTWPSWGTYAAIGAGVLALVWLSGRRR